jgi:hypothetical protein
MTATLAPIRRIVTGIDADGKSYIVEDGESPAQKTVEARPGYRITNLWRTTRGEKLDSADSITEQAGVSPPPKGTVLRVLDFPPDPADSAAHAEAMAATFGQMFPDADHKGGKDTSLHPGMHTTQTIDYAIMLEGELVAIMDKEETVMRAGDILIQRATNHAWANRSGKQAKIAFVLVDPS